MRIFLPLARHLVILALISIVFNLPILEGILINNGIELNPGSLLIFCGVFSMSGAQFAGRASMIAALQRLKAEQGFPEDLPGQLAALGIRPGKVGSLSALLRSHPPLDGRVLTLQCP